MRAAQIEGVKVFEDRQRNTLTLVGEVNSDEERLLAAEAAGSVAGGRTIQNRITVRRQSGGQARALVAAAP